MWSPDYLAALAATEQRVRRDIESGDPIGEYRAHGPARTVAGTDLRWAIVAEVRTYTLRCKWTNPETGEAEGDAFEVHTIGYAVHVTNASSIIPDPEIAYFWPQLEEGDDVLLLHIRHAADPEIPAGWWALLPLLPPSFLAAEITQIDQQTGCLMCRPIDADGVMFGDERPVYVRVIDSWGLLTSSPRFDLLEEILWVGQHVHIEWSSGAIKGWWLVVTLHEGMGICRWAKIQFPLQSGDTSLRCKLCDGAGIEYGNLITVRVQGVTANRLLTRTPNLSICTPLFDGGQVIQVKWAVGAPGELLEAFWYDGPGVFETCPHPTS